MVFVLANCVTIYCKFICKFETHPFVIWVCFFPCLLLPRWWFECWNLTIINRGSNATLWWPNSLSGKLMEKERETVSEKGESSWLGVRIIFPLWSWPVMTYQTHFSTLLSLWVQLRGRRRGYPVVPSHSSPLFLNFFLPGFNLAHTQSLWIYIVMSAQALSHCLCVR